jgi:hypothetical protein
MITDDEDFNKFFKATCRIVFNIKGEEPLKKVRIKGTGYGFYWSIYDKEVVRVHRDVAGYLLDEEPHEDGRLKVFYIARLFTGVVILVEPSDIIDIGYD